MGFHVGFGAAAFGMALGLIQYVVFRKNLGTVGRDPTNPLPRAAYAGMWRRGSLVIIVVVAAVVLTGLVPWRSSRTSTTTVIVVAPTAYFAVLLRIPR